MSRHRRPRGRGADDVSALGTTLSVWAHPDDETYLAGGLMAALRDAGQRVVCVTATRGEAWDPAAEPEEVEAFRGVRSRELAAALGVLGVDEHHWLDHPDGGCAQVPPQVAVGQLAALVERVRPDTVVTFGPDGFTGHADHCAVSGWVAQAVAASGAGSTVLHAVATRSDLTAASDVDARFAVYEQGLPRLCRSNELALRLDLSGAQLDRKVAALHCHRSQTEGLRRDIGDERFAAWVAAESFAPARGDLVSIKRVS